jgi:hypothetical protein
MLIVIMLLFAAFMYQLPKTATWAMEVKANPSVDDVVAARVARVVGHILLGVSLFLLTGALTVL